MKQKIIAQGAEAIITKEGEKIIKNRIPKSYRLPILDEQLRKKRTKSEAKILEKLQGKVNVPKLLKQNQFDIEIEFINGDKLSNTLNSYTEKKQQTTMKLLGKELTKMHNLGIIHSDLTTSNMILVNNSKQTPKKNNLPHQHQIINTGSCQATIKESEAQKLYIIDFGLSFHSFRLEDKAVDLHLIKQALEAKHFQNYKKLYKSFISAYKPKDKKQVLAQLQEVESRGRYKH